MFTAMLAQRNENSRIMHYDRSGMGTGIYSCPCPYDYMETYSVTNP